MEYEIPESLHDACRAGTPSDNPPNPDHQQPVNVMDCKVRAISEALRPAAFAADAQFRATSRDPAVHAHQPNSSISPLIKPSIHCVRQNLVPDDPETHGDANGGIHAGAGPPA